PDVAASGRFVTLFLMEVDPAVRELRYVRAGHDPAMLASPEAGLQELTTPGMALGVLEDSVYTMSRTTYEPGSLAACSTDGVWEARSAAGETYGKPRLESLVAEQAASPAQAVVDAVLADHRRFLAGAEAQDDATIIAVKLL
ncbi:MAG: PP2C family protein-serine/threonine phosphatase, partial [Desulfovibrionaceae bacterium]